MLKFTLSIVFSIFCFVALSQWNLVWSDEFSGNSLDLSKWTYELGGGGWGNNESQYYTSNATNLQVSNDMMKIIAIEQTIGSYPYTSARIITKGKYEVRYGKIEARIKIPMGQGVWPAFWMLGSNIDMVSWPSCGEIDVIEHINNENMTHGTAHWNNGGHAYYGNSSNTLDPTEFHVYSIEWNQTAIKWFIDGVQFHVMNIANGINGTSEFHEPFFLIINLAIGGNWPGYPNSSTTFPQELVVDYVRVYKDESELSLEEVLKPEINIVPNPATGAIQIDDLQQGEKITIKSMDGKTCLEFDVTCQIYYDISSLLPGNYIVEVLSDNNSITRSKFVKQ